jgi:hypothetical protein
MPLLPNIDRREVDAGILEPVASDKRLAGSREARLDRLYKKVDNALRQLCEEVGVAA